MAEERDNDWESPHSNNQGRGGSPGASEPGEAGYEGEVGVGDEGAHAGPESFQDPFGRPDQMAEIENNPT